MKLVKILCPVCEGVALVADERAELGWRRIDSAGSMCMVEDTKILEVTCAHCGGSWHMGIVEE